MWNVKRIVYREELKLIIEKNRKAYKLSEEHGNKTYLTLVETNEGWGMLAIGWEYTHWYEIGERGGLAEAGLLKFDSSLKTKIESYIQTYRTLFQNTQSLQELFEDFEITTTISLHNNSSTYERNRKHNLITEYGFKEISTKVYKKTIRFEENELLKKGDQVFTFKPLKEIQIAQPATTTEQLALFGYSYILT